MIVITIPHANAAGTFLSLSRAHMRASKDIVKLRCGVGVVIGVLSLATAPAQTRRAALQTAIHFLAHK
jgi:hypothetical protein